MAIPARPAADLVVVQADLALGLLEALLDGLITNGKFCCTRRGRLGLTWWHRPLRLRRSGLQTDAVLVGEPDDARPGPSAASSAPAATATVVGIRPTSCWCAGQPRKTTTPGRWGRGHRRCLMRVAVYARVSTTRQAQAQTIEQQLDRLVAAVTERGWTLDERHVYRDDGYSGAGLGRPGLDCLRDHAALAEVDLVRGHRARPAGPQLCPPGVAHRRAGPARLPGRVSGPADEPRSARSVAVADPRGGGRVRAHADRRADAPRAPGQVAGGHAAALDHAAVRLPAGPGTPPGCGRGAGGA